MTVVDIPQAVWDNNTILMTLAEGTNISGWSIQFDLSKRLGSTAPFYQAFAASGLNNVSGINVTNGPQGQFTTAVPASVFSGIVASGYDPTGAFAIKWRRTDYPTTISAGYLVVSP